MADYVVALKKDLVEQFRGKANIEALVEVIGAQFQQVYDFYDQLRYNRDVYTAVGKNLDGVGDIAVLTRMEAAQIAGDPIPFEVIDDERYLDTVRKDTTPSHIMSVQDSRYLFELVAAGLIDAANQAMHRFAVPVPR